MKFCENVCAHDAQHMRVLTWKHAKAVRVLKGSLKAVSQGVHAGVGVVEGGRCVRNGCFPANNNVGVNRYAYMTENISYIS